MNINPQRLTQLLSSDPAWIAEFIVLSNTNGVADRISDVLGNRPTGLDGIQRSLQILLDAGRTKDFVYVLSVPLNLTALTDNEVIAVYGAVAADTTPDTLSRALALNALRAWSEEPTTQGKSVANPTPEAAAPAATPMDPAKKKRVVRAVLIGIGIVLFVIGTAYAIRVLRR